MQSKSKRAETRRRARRALWWAMGISLVAVVAPFGGLIGYPLSLLYTFCHELWHGLTAELIGGDFTKLYIYAAGGGTAVSAQPDLHGAQALVSIGGLVGPSISAALFFWFAKWRRTSIATLILFSFVAASSLFWAASIVTGLTSIFWCILPGLVVFRFRQWAQTACVFLAIQLGLSVFSRSDYLFVRDFQRDGETRLSDIAKVADTLGVMPYFMWGLVVGTFSVSILAVGILLYWRSVRPDAGSDSGV